METTLRTSTNTSLSIEDRDTEISRVGSAEIRNLESYLRGLEVIANLSPLLGLLGTVLGMIKAFARLESAGTKVDPAILAGGIWEALLTTAFGLSVAIPALAAFYILEGQVENVRAQMKDATIRVLGILSSR
jgi:biopolymer transport protein ExbB